MKTIQVKTAAALLMVASSVLPAYAQDRGHGRGRDGGDRPQQQRERGGEDRRSGGQPSWQRQPQGNGPQQSYRRRDDQPQFREQRQGNWQRDNNRREPLRPQYGFRDNGYRGGSSFGYRSNGGWQGGLRWSDRGGYRGRFIPQNRFYSSFGRGHYFQIGRPVYTGGFARFSYGGFGFQILDPVPAYWGPSWYDSDDVYVDYEDDGYYMYNRSYPGVGIAVNIDF